MILVSKQDKFIKKNQNKIHTIIKWLKMNFTQLKIYHVIIFVDLFNFLSELKIEKSSTRNDCQNILLIRLLYISLSQLVYLIPFVNRK